MRLRLICTFVLTCLVLASASRGIAQIGGVMGGIGTAPQEAYQGPFGTEDHPARVSSGVMAGLILTKVQPEYPQGVRVSGAVVLIAKIDPSGKVVDLKVISGPEILRDAALRAVRQWTYKPYVLNGQPVYVQTTVTVMFSLDRD